MKLSGKFKNAISISDNPDEPFSIYKDYITDNLASTNENYLCSLLLFDDKSTAFISVDESDYIWKVYSYENTIEGIIKYFKFKVDKNLFGEDVKVLNQEKEDVVLDLILNFDIKKLKMEALKNE